MEAIRAFGPCWKVDYCTESQTQSLRTDNESLESLSLSLTYDLPVSHLDEKLSILEVLIDLSTAAPTIILIVMAVTADAKSASISVDGRDFRQ